MGLTRRRLLQLGGLGLAAFAADLPWPRAGRVRQAGAEPSAATEPLLVVIFLRGGADGLHLVPPVGDPDYARARGALALAKPLAFVDGFGLHPALEPLSGLVQRGELAVVHAVGSSDRSRSHFEAQDRMELGAGERRGDGSGWLARGLGAVAPEGPFARLALASGLPLALRGSGGFAIADPARFGLGGAGEGARQALAARYAAAGDDVVAAAGRSALAALDSYASRVGDAAGRGGARGAPRRRGRPDPPLPERVRQLLALERAGLGLSAVALDAHGWDTHRGQGTEQGAMARPLRELAQGLAALSEGLRGRRDWLAVALTEFGRTVRPNGSGGTDHGTASALLVAGPRVRPGVHGAWPGLDAGALHEGRDLAVTTDTRQVLHEVLAAHLGAGPPDGTFPGLAPAPVGVLA